MMSVRLYLVDHPRGQGLSIAEAPETFDLAIDVVEGIVRRSSNERPEV